MNLFVLFFAFYTVKSKVLNLKTRIIPIDSNGGSHGIGGRPTDDFSKGLYIVHTNDKNVLSESLGIDELEHVYQENVFLVHIDPSSWDEEQRENILESILFKEKLLSSDKSILNFENVHEERRTFSPTSSSVNYTNIDLVLYFYGSVTNEDEYRINGYEGVNASSSRVVDDRMYVTLSSNHHETMGKLKNEERIYWIERVWDFELLNHYANQVIQKSFEEGDLSKTLNEYGLDGEGQIIGISDTGLDFSNCFFYDPETPVLYLDQVNVDQRKIYYYQNLGDHYGEVGLDGHGTHVAGSVAGKVYGDASTSDFVSKWNGAAPEAKIFFQDVGTSTESLAGIPDDLDDLFSLPYELGTRIHTNSWGCAYTSYFTCEWDCECEFVGYLSYGGVTYSPGDIVPSEICENYFGVSNGRCCEVCNSYSSNTRDTDKFTYENDEMLILFAAGNDGSVSDTRNILSQANTKNGLVVGASQTSNDGFMNSLYWKDYRDVFSSVCSICGDCDVDTIDECCLYGQPAGCTEDSVRAACCPPDTSYGEDISSYPTFYDESNLAYFSSRGPTQDGRIKPDVVVPGRYITSAKSQPSTSSLLHCGSYEGQAEDWETQALTRMQGTSMATPLMAGTAGLIRQYFVDGYYPSGNITGEENVSMGNVSGTLIKAVIVHSAEPLDGVFLSGNGNWYYISSASSSTDLQGFGLPRPSQTLKLEGGSPDGYSFSVRDRETLDSSSVDTSTIIYNLLRVEDNLVHEQELPFKVTITWYDPPGNVGATDVLLDDIDLKVINGGTTTYWGNDVTGGDTLNTVEKVTIPYDDISVGDTLEIQVSIKSVTSTTVKYSIIVSGMGVECQDSEMSLSSLCLEKIVVFEEEEEEEQCDPGYYGTNCSVTTCFSVFSNLSEIVCSGSGDCWALDTCSCEENYYGIACAVTTCYGGFSNSSVDDGCGDYGNCTDFDICACENGYFGGACDVTTCNAVLSNVTSEVCSGNSSVRCWPVDNCVCLEGYEGDDCENSVVIDDDSDDDVDDDVDDDIDDDIDDDSDDDEDEEEEDGGSATQCEYGYYGENCSITVCFGSFSNESGVVCSGNGLCWPRDTCTCQNDELLGRYYGLECNGTYCYDIVDTDVSVCSFHGDCDDFNLCTCTEGYIGEECDIMSCFGVPANETSSCGGDFGTCVGLDVCACEDNYYGDSCGVTDCDGVLSTSVNVCEGNGLCWPRDICTCESGYFGSYCEVWTCGFLFSNNTEDVCGGSGACIGPDECLCDSGFTYEEDEGVCIESGLISGGEVVKSWITFFITVLVVFLY